MFQGRYINEQERIQRLSHLKTIPPIYDPTKPLIRILQKFPAKILRAQEIRKLDPILAECWIMLAGIRNVQIGTCSVSNPWFEATAHRQMELMQYL